MNDITIRVVRPLCMNGERIESGTTLKLTPLAAAEVLSSGRAELLHEADAELCLQATRDEIARQLKRAGRAPEAPPQGWPWRPI